MDSSPLSLRALRANGTGGRGDGVDAGDLRLLCASVISRVPLLAALIEQFPRASFLGQPLASQNTFICGPVAWRTARGRGLLRGLYDALRRLCRRLRRGCRVHCEGQCVRWLPTGGLSMTIAGEFAFSGKPYWILAFHVPPPPLLAGPRRPRVSLATRNPLAPFPAGRPVLWPIAGAAKARASG
jgi:hypothetical protein